jgi:hypothetical protein
MIMCLASWWYALVRSLIFSFAIEVDAQLGRGGCDRAHYMYFYGSSVSGLVLRMLVSNMIFMVWKNVGKYSERYGGLPRRTLNSNVMQESDSALLKTLGSCILVGSTASDRFRCIR